jgi:hypothetical protein
VLSRTTRELVDGLPLTDLGEHRLKDIPGAVSIFQLGSKRFPPLKTISNTNLPRPASSFIGRERELRELLATIRSARLVTLTGPGGSGKTRLALEAAATLVPSYKAGVFWVGLAPLRDPALVSETIAQTLGAKDGLAEHIGERQLLLLVDNLNLKAGSVEDCPRRRPYVTALLVPPAVRTTTGSPCAGRVPSKMTSHVTERTCAAGTGVAPKITSVAPQAKPLPVMAMPGPCAPVLWSVLMVGTTCKREQPWPETLNLSLGAAHDGTATCSDVIPTATAPATAVTPCWHIPLASRSTVMK